MGKEWKKIDTKMIYKNKWIELYEDKVIRPDGNEGIYGYLHKWPGVTIIVYNRLERKIYLLKEYRYPIKKTVINLPTGAIDGEDIFIAAKRECYEETGIKIDNLIHLGGYYEAPGHETTHNDTILALDSDISALKTNGQEGDEAITEIFTVTIDELKKIILNGEIECGLTLASLSLFLIYIEKNNL